MLAASANLKFFAHVPRQIMILGFPLLGLRIEKKHSGQFWQKLVNGPTQQPSHVRQSPPSLFVKETMRASFGEPTDSIGF